MLQNYYNLGKKPQKTWHFFCEYRKMYYLCIRKKRRRSPWFAKATGELAEWSIALDSKSGIPLWVSGVWIPHSPQKRATKSAALFSLLLVTEIFGKMIVTDYLLRIRSWNIRFKFVYGLFTSKIAIRSSSCAYWWSSMNDVQTRSPSWCEPVVMRQMAETP